VLRLVEADIPVPAADEVLIKVHASTVNRTDAQARSGRPVALRPVMRYFKMGGLRRPLRQFLGNELAGTVEAIGAGVTKFQVGDRVFGDNVGRFGAHAEYMVMREGAPLVRIPANVTFEDAAATPDGFIHALNCLRSGDLHPGRSVLVYGASGAIGTAGVQIARILGADVTAVCNTKNLELARSLGAERVIDYTTQDFAALDDPYDVIFDAVGKDSYRHCKGSLKHGGIYLSTDHLSNLILALLTSKSKDKRVKFPIPPRYDQPDVEWLAALLGNGQYRAVIDRTCTLEEIVDATRYVETGQKTGSVVVIVVPEGRD
jgi:NADPH:quinone reductase-like Zn-dependent oxidoreductase